MTFSVKYRIEKFFKERDMKSKKTKQNILETKKCWNCSKILPIQAFGWGQSRCMKCNRILALESYEKRKGTPEFKRQKVLAARKYRKNHPLETRARANVYNALKKGILKKSEQCDECGATGKLVSHHHLGYEAKYSLFVKWLCTSCHGKKHRSW